MSPPIRVAKFLSHAGVCSRRPASRLITAERVRVNGAGRNTLPMSVPMTMSPDGEEVLDYAETLFCLSQTGGIDCKL